MVKPQSRACGAVLGWRQIRGILVFDKDGYTARCPSCGAELRQVLEPRPGQKCKARVLREK